MKLFTAHAMVLILLSSSTRGIEITQGPSNITVCVGDPVTLPCKYTGTNDQPYWRIGGIIYASSDLPAGYVYINEGLHIRSVWALLNNTVYICFFTNFVEGRITSIKSQPAFLTVRIRSVRISSTSSGFAPSGSNTGYLSSLSISHILQLSSAGRAYYYNVTNASTTQPLTLCSPTVEYSNLPSTYSRATSAINLPSHSSSVLATPQKTMKQMQMSSLLISGISASVVGFLLVCVSVITCLTVCLIIRKWRKQITEKPTNSEYGEPEEFKSQEVPTEPEYEEPIVLRKLQKNIAYEIPPSRIKTAKNEAYGSISNT